MSAVVLISAGGSGSYHLIDPAIGVYFDEAEPAITRPKGMYVQRTYSKKATPERALDLWHAGAIVMRLDLAKQAFTGTGVTLAPIDIRMTDGKTVKGWGQVIIDEWVAPGAEPVGQIARVLDAPKTIVATPELAKKLEKLTGRAIRAAAPDQTLETFVPEWANVPAYPRGALDALRAKKPTKATRDAASKHPVTAAIYAILVDRKAHPATRKGANKNVWCAFRYAYTLDRAIDDALAKRMLASNSWDAENIASERLALAEINGEEPPAQELATRDLPKIKKRGPRIDKSIEDEEVRDDIDEMTGRGLKRLELANADDPSEVIDRLHRYVDGIQARTVKLGRKAGVAHLELACAWSEALHRAFGWQWASIPTDDGDVVGLVSPDRAYANASLSMIASLAKRRDNTVALLFNMIAAGNMPKSKRGGLVFVS